MMVSVKRSAASGEHPAESLIQLALWHGMPGKPHPYCLTGSLSGHRTRRSIPSAGMNAKFAFAVGISGLNSASDCCVITLRSAWRVIRDLWPNPLAPGLRCKQLILATVLRRANAPHGIRIKGDRFDSFFIIRKSAEPGAVGSLE